MSKHRGHKEPPHFHIAKNQGEIDAHGPHVDGIVKTEYGSHQIRIIDMGDKKMAEHPLTGELRNVHMMMDGSNQYAFDDQHNFSGDFTGLGHTTRINVNDPNYWANRDDATLLNGEPDPRGTAMGGINHRKPPGRY